MERRELVRWLVGTAGLACLDGLAADDLLAFGSDVHRHQSTGQGFRALNAHAQRTVTIAAERIIPRSDTPGATDADVVSFVDKMLADWYTPEERDRFLNGLRELDDRSRARRGRNFVDCSETEQNTILAELDAEVVANRRNPGGTNPEEHWFAMLKYLTVFGFCTSEVGMRQVLGEWPRPTRYDGCAPVPLRSTPGGTGRR